MIKRMDFVFKLNNTDTFISILVNILRQINNNLRF